MHLGRGLQGGLGPRRSPSQVKGSGWDPGPEEPWALQAAELARERHAGSSLFLGLDQHGRRGLLVPRDDTVSCMQMGCFP